jgi:hypothetical protein
MQNLASYSKYDSSKQHYSKRIIFPTHSEDEVSHKAKYGSDDEDDTGSILVNEDATQQRHYDVGEGIKCIQQIELRLTNCFIICS